VTVPTEELKTRKTAATRKRREAEWTLVEFTSIASGRDGARHRRQWEVEFGKPDFADIT